jgi:hypothetical protein
MKTFSEQDLRSYLRLNREPLTELHDEDENSWRLGPIQVSKKHSMFRAGFGHPILASTRFALEPFDLDGTQRIAVVLHSGGKPPEYFVGWVSSADEAKARGWIEMLNDELKRRTSGE